MNVSSHCHYAEIQMYRRKAVHTAERQMFYFTSCLFSELFLKKCVWSSICTSFKTVLVFDLY